MFVILIKNRRMCTKEKKKKKINHNLIIKLVRIVRRKTPRITLRNQTFLCSPINMFA